MRFRVGGKRNRRALRWGARAGGWRLPARRVGRAGSAPRAARWSLSASAVRQAPVLPAGTSGRRAVRGAGASLLPGRSRGRAERWGGLTARAGRPASGRAATGGSGAAAPGTAGTYPPGPPSLIGKGGEGQWPRSGGSGGLPGWILSGHLPLTGCGGAIDRDDFGRRRVRVARGGRVVGDGGRAAGDEPLPYVRFAGVGDSRSAGRAAGDEPLPYDQARAGAERWAVAHGGGVVAGGGLRPGESRGGALGGTAGRRGTSPRPTFWLVISDPALGFADGGGPSPRPSPRGRGSKGTPAANAV